MSGTSIQASPALACQGSRSSASSGVPVAAQASQALRLICAANGWVASTTWLMACPRRNCARPWAPPNPPTRVGRGWATGDCVTPAYENTAAMPARCRAWAIRLGALGGGAGVACRGGPRVVRASGDPFWFGAGGSLAAHLAPQEWRCHAQPSTFSLLASRLGWKLEDTVCLGLHAGHVEQLLPHLSPGRQSLVLLRDGAAVAALA